MGKRRGRSFSWSLVSERNDVTEAGSELGRDARCQPFDVGGSGSVCRQDQVDPSRLSGFEHDERGHRPAIGIGVGHDPVLMGVRHDLEVLPPDPLAHAARLQQLADA